MAVPSVSKNLKQIRKNTPNYTATVRTVSPDTRGHLQSDRKLWLQCCNRQDVP